MVIHSEKRSNGIEAPAFTIAPVHTGRGRAHGWKTPRNNIDDTFSLFHHCKGLDQNNMSLCVKKDTYEKEDFLNSVNVKALLANSSISTNDSNNFSSRIMWSEDLTVPNMGRHYTLTSSATITQNAQIKFDLVNECSYQIWVHDEDFFIPNNNPFGPPSIYWKINNKPPKESEDSHDRQNTQNNDGKQILRKETQQDDRRRIQKR